LTLRVNQSLAKTAASVNYASARLPRLNQIDAPFSSRLSRDTRNPTSGLHRTTDIVRPARLVCFVPIAETAFAGWETVHSRRALFHATRSPKQFRDWPD